MSTFTKRILATMLCACSAASISACGTETTTETTAAQKTTAAIETEPENKEPTAYDYLEQKDYGGYEFRTIAPTGLTRYLPFTVVPEEVTGEVINDAAFKRNENVEEYFNIRLQYVDGVSLDKTSEMITQNIRTGDDSFDFVLQSVRDMGKLVIDGAFLERSPKILCKQMNNRSQSDENQPKRTSEKEQNIWYAHPKNY